MIALLIAMAGVAVVPPSARRPERIDHFRCVEDVRSGPRTIRSVCRVTRDAPWTIVRS